MWRYDYNYLLAIFSTSERDDVDSVFVQFDRLCHVAQSPNNQTESQVGFRQELNYPIFN